MAVNNQKSGNHTGSNKTVSNQSSFVLTLAGILLVLLLVVVVIMTTSNSSDSAAGNGKTGQTDANGSVTKNNTAADVVPTIEDPQFKTFVSQFLRKDSKDPLAIGKIDAPVTMLQFADFSCPMCYQFELKIHPQLQKLIDDGTLRMEYHHMVIFQDKYNSMLGARAGEAAGKQGKFWEFLKAATDKVAKAAENGEDTHITWSDQLAEDLAKQAGVGDLAKFKADYTNPELEKQIKAASDKIQASGVIQGTPGFIINQRLVTGVYPLEVFQATIKDAAKTGK